MELIAARILQAQRELEGLLEKTRASALAATQEWERCLEENHRLASQLAVATAAAAAEVPGPAGSPHPATAAAAVLAAAREVEAVAKEDCRRLAEKATAAQAAACVETSNPHLYWHSLLLFQLSTH